MKKVLVLLLCCAAWLNVYSQAPFTINFSNFPIYEQQIYSRTPAPDAPSLTPAANGTWDFRNYPGVDFDGNFYVPETDPFYTNAGIDVYIDDFKSLNANLGYIIYYEYDFNLGGVEEKGIYVDLQRYGLAAITGNPNDSLIIPFQAAVYPSGRKLMKFPCTYQSGWQSQSRRVIDFNLTVNAAGLSNTPCKHIYTIYRTDTIVGWGKMRVYADGAPSIEYEVLVNKSTQFAVDSFLVGGFPAPPALLAPFGMAQGQQTGRANRYIVYRKNNSTPLAIIYYGSNNFTTPINFFSNVQNLTTTDAVAPIQAAYATVLFPNPTHSGDINLQIIGQTPALGTYEIIDQLGRVVQSGTADFQNELLQLSLQGRHPNGHYILRVLDDKKQTIATEPFILEGQ